MKSPKTQPILEQFPVETISIDSIDPDRSTQFVNARVALDPNDIEELAKSIEADGCLIHPIIVRRRPPPREDRYLLRAGYRRVAAFRLRGWPEIRATILPDDLSDLDGFWINLSENTSRKQLTDYEIAKRGQELIDRFGVTTREYADRVHVTPKHVNNLLRWLRNLPPEILDAWKADHALITQACLEKMSHLSAEEALVYWRSQFASPTLDLEGSNREGAVHRMKRPSDRALVALYGSVESCKVPKTEQRVRQSLLELIEYCMGKRRDLPTLGLQPRLSLRGLQQRERREKQKLAGHREE